MATLKHLICVPKRGPPKLDGIAIKLRGVVKGLHLAIFAQDGKSELI